MNAYVLVGGRSRRMGESKTGLFFERVVAAARPVFARVLAVQRFGGERVSIPTLFEEPHEGDGPIFGIARALRDAGSRAFILAVDYPLITTDVLLFLRDHAGVPVWNGKPQPLCATWDAALLPELESRIARGRFDLQGLRENDIIEETLLRARFRGEPLMNVNTPEELEAAEKAYG